MDFFNDSCQQRSSLPVSQHFELACAASYKNRLHAEVYEIYRMPHGSRNIYPALVIKQRHQSNTNTNKGSSVQSRTIFRHIRHSTDTPTIAPPPPPLPLKPQGLRDRTPICQDHLRSNAINPTAGGRPARRIHTTWLHLAKRPPSAAGTVVLADHGGRADCAGASSQASQDSLCGRSLLLLLTTPAWR